MEEARMYLERVKLSGYRSIQDLNIELDSHFNVIIGKNAVGKTNFISFLEKSLNSKYKGLTNFRSSLIFRRGSDEMSITASFNLGQEVSRDISQAFDMTGQLKTPSREIEINGIPLTGDPSKGSRFSQLAKKGLTYLTTIIRHGVPSLYWLVDKPLTFFIKQGEADEELLKLILDEESSFVGKYFFSFLQIGLMGEEEAFDSSLVEQELNRLFQELEIIKDFVKRITPIEDFRFSENRNIFFDAENKRIGVSNLFIEFQINGQWMPFGSLSDGTKRMFYLISEIAFDGGQRWNQFGPTSNPHQIILLEEPELGIHPHQLFLLASFLKEQSFDKQIIITTHSPQLLDVLSENELDKIIVAYTAGQSGTKMRHLTAEETEKAKQYMNEVGELSYYWLHSDLE